MEFATLYTTGVMHVLFFLFVIFVCMLVLAVPAVIIAWILSSFTDKDAIIVGTGIAVAVLMIPVAVHAFDVMYLQPDRDRVVQQEREKANPLIVGQPTVQRFILVSRRPPKHFYVTLKSVTTNAVYQDVYVSKHCNNHAQFKDGDAINLQVTPQWRAQTPNDIQYVFTNLYSALCE